MCPVYLNAYDVEGMHVEARYSWLEWWFHLNIWMHSKICDACDVFGIEYQRGFPFKVTGEVKN